MMLFFIMHTAFNILPVGSFINLNTDLCRNVSCRFICLFFIKFGSLTDSCSVC